MGNSGRRDDNPLKFNLMRAPKSRCLGGFFCFFLVKSRKELTFAVGFVEGEFA